MADPNATAQAGSAVIPLVSIAIGAGAAILGGFLPGFFGRKADVKQRTEKAQRTSAYFLGCATHLAQVTALIRSTAAPDEMDRVQKAAEPFLYATSDPALVKQLSVNAILAVMQATNVATHGLLLARLEREKFEASAARAPGVDQTFAMGSLGRMYESVADIIFDTVNKTIAVLGGPGVDRDRMQRGAASEQHGGNPFLGE